MNPNSEVIKLNKSVLPDVVSIEEIKSVRKFSHSLYDTVKK